jgi:hypothetical protein
MAVVALTEWGTKKKINWWIYGFIFFGFIFTAFFQAWQDQSMMRIAAENDGRFYKQESAYEQKRIERLSDILLKANSTNKSLSETIAKNNVQSPILQNVQASNITLNTDYSFKPNNVIQFVGADNNGNVAQLNNSPNALITQSIVNPVAKPIISGTNLISINVPIYGAYKRPIYKTEFSLDVSSSSPLVDSYVGYTNTSIFLAFPPDCDYELGVAGFGVAAGWNYTAQAKITFLTFNKVNGSDFHFYVGIKNTQQNQP